jgi:hypothetical protein
LTDRISTDSSPSGVGAVAEAKPVMLATGPDLDAILSL